MGYNFNDPVTGDFTLRANWDCRYNVVFYPNNGTEPFKVVVRGGTTVPEPEPPVFGNCKFTGWTRTYTPPPEVKQSIASVYHKVTLHKQDGEEVVMMVKDGDRLDPELISDSNITGWETV